MTQALIRFTIKKENKRSTTTGKYKTEELFAFVLGDMKQFTKGITVDLKQNTETFSYKLENTLGSNVKLSLQKFKSLITSDQPPNLILTLLSNGDISNNIKIDGIKKRDVDAGAIVQFNFTDEPGWYFLNTVGQGFFEIPLLRKLSSIGNEVSEKVKFDSGVIFHVGDLNYTSSFGPEVPLVILARTKQILIGETQPREMPSLSNGSVKLETKGQFLSFKKKPQEYGLSEDIVEDSIEFTTVFGVDVGDRFDKMGFLPAPTVATKQSIKDSPVFKIIPSNNPVSTTVPAAEPFPSSNDFFPNSISSSNLLTLASNIPENPVIANIAKRNSPGLNVPDSVLQWKGLVKKIASVNEFDTNLVLAILWQESTGNPSVISGNDLGLMQLNSVTAANLFPNISESELKEKLVVSNKEDKSPEAMEIVRRNVQGAVTLLKQEFDAADSNLIASSLPTTDENRLLFIISAYNAGRPTVIGNFPDLPPPYSINTEKPPLTPILTPNYVHNILVYLKELREVVDL